MSSVKISIYYKKFALVYIYEYISVSPFGIHEYISGLRNLFHCFLNRLYLKLNSFYCCYLYRCLLGMFLYFYVTQTRKHLARGV